MIELSNLKHCHNLNVIVFLSRQQNTLIKQIFYEVYSSNQITKKEPKSDNPLSKFDWHEISPSFWAITHLHNLKVLLENNKTSFSSNSLIL